MLSIKHILFLLVLTIVAGAVNAQQDASALPSLFNAQTNSNANADDKNIETVLKQKMFVKVFTNKSRIFIGEPVMATYKFYVASNITDQPSVTKQPEFTGFSVKELNFSQAPETELINNQPYAAYVIRKVQLTPLQHGMLSLGKAFVNNAVEMYDPADPYATKKLNVLVNNAEAAVEVNDLPEKNKPENFYGITGTFTISASAVVNKIPVGENGHLIVKINGAGNLEAIDKPEILWPANIQHYDGNDSQHIDQDNFPVSGDKTFDIPFVGSKEGLIVIPPVHFSFFNTSSKSYQTVSTDSIHLTFTKALSKKDSLIHIVNYDITNRKYLWIVPAIAVTVALIGFISYKRNKKNLQPVTPNINITAVPSFENMQPAYHIKFRTDFSSYLDELKNINDNRQFFSTAKNLLTKAVAERLDSNNHSEQILMTELKQRTYNAPVCSKVSALYEVINVNLYAPYEIENDLSFYFNEVKAAVEELQSQS